MTGCEMKVMIVGWIKNFISAILPEQISQGAQTFEKKAKAKLIDVTDGVSLAEEARKRSSELLSMIRKGGVNIDQLRFWLNSRRKVKGQLSDAFDMPDITEEITEKINEIAKEDPFYRKMFG